MQHFLVQLFRAQRYAACQRDRPLFDGHLQDPFYLDNQLGTRLGKTSVASLIIAGPRLFTIGVSSISSPVVCILNFHDSYGTVILYLIYEAVPH